MDNPNPDQPEVNFEDHILLDLSLLLIYL